MNKQSNLFGFKSFLIFAFCLMISISAFASATGEKNYQLVTRNLSEKLQSDLANDNVTVKLNKVEEYKISKNEIGLKGDGICLMTDNNNQLPIQFDVKVNTVNQSVSEVKYDFVESASEYAPTSNEEILMQELMKQISRDYKTENIVIAIDAFENVANSSNGKEFTGIGEVRIGDLVWNKIKFDVVVNPQTQKANKIVYKVEK